MVKQRGCGKIMLVLLHSNGIVKFGGLVHKMGFDKTEVPMTVDAVGAASMKYFFFHT